MTDDWTPATDAEAWALARGPGWVETERLDARADLDAEVCALMARRDALQQEIDAAVREAVEAARDAAHEAARAEVAAVVDALEDARRVVIDAAARAAIDVASALVADEVTAAPDRILTLVRRAIDAAADREVLAVRVHPSNVDAVAAGGAGVSVVADASCGPGDVIIDTQRGRVDGRLATWCSLLETDVRASILAAAEVSDDG